MVKNRTSERYGLASILLHWIMLLMVLAVYATIELREFWPKGSPTREMLKNWHFMLGLSIFGLVWLRIGARLVWSAPAPLQGPAWRNRIAMATHLSLYLFLIAMPVAGWLVLSGEGKPIPFFGFELPPLVATSPALAKQVEEFHELGGTIGYVLIGLHAAASLFHHYILKDRVLSRMSPGRS
ncbi:cytochrome b [Sphingopyxis fribergensis]